MRTLRLSLVATVILMLLGGLSGAVVAQSPSPLAQGDEDAPVWVKLLTRGDLRIEGSPSSFEPGAGFAKTVRDIPVGWDNSTYSDPRLDGSQHFLYNEDCSEDGICVSWGTVEIAGPEGTTWTGWVHEIDDADTDGVDDTSWHLVLTGTGPYEGLTAILFSLGVWEQFPNEYGVIYRGDPPEVISDPVTIVVAKGKARAGFFVMPALRAVSASEVSPDVFTDLAQVRGRKAAVDIPAGTPITPDMLEPPAE
jgi:hypothetical protein